MFPNRVLGLSATLSNMHIDLIINTNGIDFILDAVKGTSYDRMRLVYLDELGGIGK